MPKVVGVRFHGTGKAYHFDPASMPLHQGDAVIVETVQGIELGIIADEIIDLPDEKLVAPLKPILRIATPEDMVHYEENRQKESEAFKIAMEKIKARNLEMHLVDVEYTFDNRKVIFYFTAEGRVDFRELVKDLAAIFRIRIELRQIGVRDEARMIGGLGICGRELCCCSFLNDFVPVSIKMAKEQSLSMNPAKISGCCGRLMCCLKYEQEAYEDAISRMPRPGHIVMTPEGQGTVEGVNLLRETVSVRLDRGGEADLVVVPNENVEIVGGKPGKKCPPGGCGQHGQHPPANQPAGKGQNESASRSKRNSRQNNRVTAAAGLAALESDAASEPSDEPETSSEVDI
jgi:cell fate regulator YaaT (PSP1 superfamily)